MKILNNKKQNEIEKSLKILSKYVINTESNVKDFEQANIALAIIMWNCGIDIYNEVKNYEQK